MKHIDKKTNLKRKKCNHFIFGIDNLIFHAGFNVYAGLISVIREQKYHDDEECDTFQKACEYLGMKWREFDLSPTPKVQSLERHEPEFMWRYRRLFAEDSI